MLFRLIFSSIIFLLLSSVCLAADLPFRKDYPDVKVVDLEELKTGYDKGTYIVVDVSPALEYNVIRVNDSYHVDFSEVAFVENLQALVAQYPDRKIAVYCNDGRCLKSYMASMEAVKAGMNNVFAFDAGIAAWSNAYPSETLLFGKRISDPKKQLIPESELKNVTLEFDFFQQKALAGNAVSIDARDPMLRMQPLPGFENALPVPLDKLIKNVINKGNFKDKQLMIFDQHGHTIQWLMYYLVDQGYSNFFFLEGGAASVLKEQEYR